MSRVAFEGVVKKYGEVTALESLDLVVEEGEFLTLLGPSGCGKTTTLRLVAGFLEPTVGIIRIDGDDVTRVPPQRRQIGMVFQDYALFPHLTVAENIGFGLEERREPRSQITARVNELLDLVRLPGVGDRYPAELSGGQRQRVALARAVGYPPRVLLMDEPLGALDLKLREAMQFELRQIQRKLGITTIYVTHDQTEAMTMSDRIAVMSLGRLVQLGSADEIYNRPRTRFVADFVGRINLLDAKRVSNSGDGPMFEVCGTTLRAPRVMAQGGSERITVAIRPEHLRLASTGSLDGGLNVLSARITARTFAGNLTTVTVVSEQGQELIVECRADEQLPERGTVVDVGWAPKRAVILED